MKYRMVYKFLALFFLVPFCLFGQVPQRPNPPRLVNDLAHIFSANQVNTLERELVNFADTTSNQIAIVTVPELYGMDKSQLAYSIGEKWGIGQRKFDNGVVILIKPKIGNSRGEVFIATGYGLEGVLNDAVCRRIIEGRMIPNFMNNDYYAGVQSALKIILPLVSGEISSKEYLSKGDDDSFLGAAIFLVFLVIFVIVIAKMGGEGPKNMGGGNGRGGRNMNAMDALFLASILGSGRGRSHGGFGGGGSFGGGGFGGFGGGRFGGGGAGGSW